MAFDVTELSILTLSPNEKATLDAKDLVRTGALKNVSRTEDGSLLFGDCRGSGGAPYTVSADLLGPNDKPSLRCTCPSRQKPCKHVLGLMFAYAQQGSSFSIAPAPQDLLDKRAKEAAPPAAPKTRTPKKTEGPRTVNKDALAKKGKEQIDALETLGAFLIDLVNAGVGGVTPKLIEGIDQQAKRMADANIVQASVALKRLSGAIAHKEEDDDDEEEEAKKTAARNLSKETEARVAWLMTQLHAMVRRGTKLLDGRLAAEGATEAECDATYDLIFTKRWQLRDLKHAGHWVANRALMELAHERRNDDLLEFADSTGYLLDLTDGTIVREWTALPYQVFYSRFNTQKLRESRRGTLVIHEAGLYPGEMINRRIRWDDKVETACVERTRQAADYEALHRHAKPIAEVIKAFRNHLRNPLHPLDVVCLVAAARVGTLGSELIVEDAAKDRLVLRDSPEAIVSGTVALRQAAAAYGPGSLAVRLFFDLPSRSLGAEPLALFVGDEHLRLHT